MAIIGILVSLLLPSLGKARERAKVAVCQSNLSQIGKAMFTYAKNNRSRYPEPGHKNGSVWPYSLNREVSDTLGLYSNAEQTSNTVFECPSNGHAPRGKKTVNGQPLYLMDQYSVLTYFDSFGSVNFKGEESPEFLGDGGMLMMESLIWWKSPSESSWSSNHSDSGRGNAWTKLKFNPRGFNQFSTNGSVRWIRINQVSKSDVMATNGAWAYFWKEE